MGEGRQGRGRGRGLLAKESCVEPKCSSTTVYDGLLYVQEQDSLGYSSADQKMADS